MTTAGKSGSLDPEKAKSFIARVEEVESEMASEQGTYMARCKELREEIAEIMDEAKAAGISKKPLRAVLKTRSLQRKLDAERDNLESEAQDTYDQIRHAIGDLADLPLGTAALDRAAKGGAAVDSLTERTH